MKQKTTSACLVDVTKSCFFSPNSGVSFSYTLRSSFSASIWQWGSEQRLFAPAGLNRSITLAQKPRAQGCQIKVWRTKKKKGERMVEKAKKKRKKSVKPINQCYKLAPDSTPLEKGECNRSWSRAGVLDTKIQEHVDIVILLRGSNRHPSGPSGSRKTKILIYTTYQSFCLWDPCMTRIYLMWMPLFVGKSERLNDVWTMSGEHGTRSLGEGALDIPVIWNNLYPPHLHWYRFYTGWPRKNATTSIINFKDIVNKTDLFFILLGRKFIFQHNDTMTINFGWGIWILRLF